ncbi:MAG TPA: BTAD domain-containing putative transcriptional regulator [Pseudolysinimonas sp.]|nr:BTAD domain-containing putative transcriptional regulator [Pseudolysinimonas sp.]
MMQFERWSLLIVAEAMLRGTTRFADFQLHLGIAPETLEARLASLVGAGIMERLSATGDGDRYILTAKGDDLKVGIHALDEWTRRWDPLSPASALSASLEAPRTEAPDAASVPRSSRVELFLLGTFRLRVDSTTIDELAIGSQRLLIFLALHDRAIARFSLAGTMWPDVSDERAGISLRAALTRLDGLVRSTVEVSKSGGLGLRPGVVVDLREGQALAHRLLHLDRPVESADLGAEAISLLSSELLPDWYDDWIIAEAEDWRQLRIGALEALGQRLLAHGRNAEAIRAGRAAMRIDPLRESPHALLIRIHLADGNQSEALGVFERYRAILHTALALEPTTQLSRLVADLLP